MLYIYILYIVDIYTNMAMFFFSKRGCWSWTKPPQPWTRENEHIVQHALDELMEGRTTFAAWRSDGFFGGNPHGDVACSLEALNK